MKKLSFVLFLIYLNCYFVYGQQKPCAFEEVANDFKNDPALLKIYNDMQPKSKWSNVKSNYQVQRNSNVVDSIPVVIHIVSVTIMNVTDSAVIAWLADVNTRLALQNSDTTSIPPAFRPFAGVYGHKLVLAHQDPDGNPTTGIERITSPHGQFPASGNGLIAVASPDSGGLAPWPPSDYVNIYVTDITGYTGGVTYGNYFMIDYSMGRQGSMIHEFGHLLGLEHLWGMWNDICLITSDPDYVLDTPPQNSSTSGFPCPAFPYYDTCTGNIGNGRMFMNYMDYSTCRVMYSVGQYARMDSIMGVRFNGWTTSHGLDFPISVEELLTSENTFIYPNPSSGSDIRLVVPFNLYNEKIKISITDLFGRVVKYPHSPHIVSANEAVLDQFEFSNGIYFLTLLDDRGKKLKTIKFLINN